MLISNCGILIALLLRVSGDHPGIKRRITGASQTNCFRVIDFRGCSRNARTTVHFTVPQIKNNLCLLCLLSKYVLQVSWWNSFTGFCQNESMGICVTFESHGLRVSWIYLRRSLIFGLFCGWNLWVCTQNIIFVEIKIKKIKLSMLKIIIHRWYSYKPGITHDYMK